MHKAVNIMNCKCSFLLPTVACVIKDCSRHAKTHPIILIPFLKSITAFGVSFIYKYIRVSFEDLCP